MLALSWYKGRDGAGAGVKVWRILHAACFMLHDICCVLYDERVEFGLVACCGLGYDKGLY